MGGAYTHAVACGLSVDCKDHQPITVTVTPDAHVTGADACNSYGKDSVPGP